MVLGADCGLAIFVTPPMRALISLDFRGSMHAVERSPAYPLSSARLLVELSTSTRSSEAQSS